ncbi:Mucin-associated surface protein (MASP) [Trypanosoma cruzi]|uniref:Mucin-associated surface protein (MASP), putative n=2 Tax=Trypanosoma cruzi TaxID=5693 RepID=Q4CSF5_TRYCC|nr:mucin-associated surface protein (MASP), putative [Trypanosoma cruzi]EAN83205.1 mucin-associated surface protein (MASP), putative [Trypanosoma cruzi]PWU89339.1 Mucin-associated surface protein (MASP) [Trypanosoma cruzi]PWU89344.1 Mucin-associated surface protein (MASP) [Trypanosoma cruzi]|eukprot:XP_805056.1 mucin-associated surface protein (MASP) [Trypanosoma cruzi strain CL Brener]
MAMMMAGRVLLVCALCVLWCGACGGYAWDFNGNESLNEQHYGANGTYCRLNSSFPFCEEKRNASKLKEAALKASNAQSGTGSGQPNADGSSGGRDNSSEKNDSDESEETDEGPQESQPPNGNVTETPTPATVTSAQTSATRTPDESDGSTAVSHTTSPLLLFLVACAAAAAVVAV